MASHTLVLLLLLSPAVLATREYYGPWSKHEKKYQRGSYGQGHYVEERPCESPVPPPCDSPEPSPCASPLPSPCASPLPPPCESPVPPPCASPVPSPVQVASPAPTPSPVSPPPTPVSTYPICSSQPAYQTDTKIITRTNTSITTCTKLNARTDNQQPWDIQALQWVIAPQCGGAVAAVMLDGKAVNSSLVKYENQMAVKVSDVLPTYLQLKATPSHICITLNNPCNNERNDYLYNQMTYFAKGYTSQPALCSSTALINTR